VPDTFSTTITGGPENVTTLTEGQTLVTTIVPPATLQTTIGAPQGPSGPPGTAVAGVVTSGAMTLTVDGIEYSLAGVQLVEGETDNYYIPLFGPI
jgi:hypothetical protein